MAPLEYLKQQEMLLSSLLASPITACELEQSPGCSQVRSETEKESQKEKAEKGVGGTEQLL